MTVSTLGLFWPGLKPSSAVPSTPVLPQSTVASNSPPAWTIDLPLPSLAELPTNRSTLPLPPGPGRVFTAPGVAIASNAHQPNDHGFEGRVASESLAALRRTGGISAVYISKYNGNREVAIQASPGFDPGKPYEVLVYNCGTGGTNAKSLEQQFVAESLRKLNAEGRNVLLVLPKSPANENTWFAGKEDLGALVPEALDQFRILTGTPLPEPQERWLMAHSGGGKSVQNAMEKAYAPHFDKILLADSTYGIWAQRTIAALRKQPGTQIATVVTAHNAARAYDQVASRRLRVDAMPSHYVHPGHNGVPSYMIAKFLSPNPSLTFSTIH